MSVYLFSRYIEFGRVLIFVVVFVKRLFGDVVALYSHRERGGERDRSGSMAVWT